MTAGEQIKAARKKAGLTQRQLGKKLGISYQAVAQWENDLRNPKIESLRAIANALGVPARDLTGAMIEKTKETSVFEEVRKTVEDICYKISPDSQCQERCPLAIYGSCMRKMFDGMLRKVEDWNAKFYGK